MYKRARCGTLAVFTLLDEKDNLFDEFASCWNWWLRARLILLPEILIRTGAKSGYYKMICFCPRASSLGEIIPGTLARKPSKCKFWHDSGLAATRIRLPRRMRIEDAGKFRRVRSFPAVPSRNVDTDEKLTVFTVNSASSVVKLVCLNFVLSSVLFHWLMNFIIQRSWIVRKKQA